MHGALLLKEAKVKLEKHLGSAWIIGYNLGVTGAKKFGRTSARQFHYYKRFKAHFKPLNVLDLILTKDLPQINKTHLVVPYRMF